MTHKSNVLHFHYEVQSAGALFDKEHKGIEGSNDDSQNASFISTGTSARKECILNCPIQKVSCSYTMLPSDIVENRCFWEEAKKEQIKKAITLEKTLEIVRNVMFVV